MVIDSNTERRFLLSVGVSDQSGHYIDETVGHAPMAALFDLRDILELIMDRFHQRTLPEHQLVKQGDKLGYPDQALQRGQEALGLAQESSLHTRAIASDFVIKLHQFRREVHAAQEQAEVGIALGTEQGFPQVLARYTILRGWALAMQGHGEEGITQLRQGLAACETLGVALSQTYYFALLAEAYEKDGQREEGLTVLAEALALVDKTGERWWEAELYQLKGEFVRQKTGGSAQQTDTAAAAEGCFHQALTIARKQQTKSLELRSAMSLSCLWQQQDKRIKAWQLLSEIYNCEHHHAHFE